MTTINFKFTHQGTFVPLENLRGSPLETRIWCRKCEAARDAYEPGVLTAKVIALPQGFILHAFCATCGWMYQKQAISKQLRAYVAVMDKSECAYCGMKQMKGRRFGLDHLTPEIEGGRNHVSNLVLCCQTCNSEKGRKTNWHKPKFGRFRE